MSKDAKAMDANTESFLFTVPNFSFGRTAVIRPLPNDRVVDVVIEGSTLTIEQLKKRISNEKTAVEEATGSAVVSRKLGE